MTPVQSLHGQRFDSILVDDLIDPCLPNRQTMKNIRFASLYGAGPVLMKDFPSRNLNQEDEMSPKTRKKMSAAQRKRREKEKAALGNKIVPPMSAAQITKHAGTLKDSVGVARRAMDGDASPLEVGTALHNALEVGITAGMDLKDFKKDQLIALVQQQRRVIGHNEKRMDEMLRSEHDRERLIVLAESSLQSVRQIEQQLLDKQAQLAHARVSFNHYLKLLEAL